MGRYTFRLPDIGEGTTEAEIVAWHVAPGQEIAEDSPLVDIMTDKATVEMASPVAGRVLALHGDVGQRVAVGAPLVEIEQAGGTETGAAGPASIAPDTPAKRPLASPATRRRARDRGIALESVPGTGAGGRVTAADLEAYTSGASGGDITETRIVGLRRRIAERTQEAARRIPHFGYVEEFDLTELEALRRELNRDGAPDRPKLALLPFFMRALARVVPDFPHINARYDDEAGILRSYRPVHVGIATQTPAGLMVPVVRHAEARDLWDCARELARVTAAARDGTATRDELSGSTITLTSLGALGGVSATPIINHPEVAILAPNRLAERPVVVGGKITVRTMMNLSSSFDHRIVDGHDAARFIHGIRQLIEDPRRLLVDGA